MDFIGSNREGLLRARSHYARGLVKAEEAQDQLEQRNELEPKREELKASALEVANAVLKSLADVQDGLAKLSELYAEGKDVSITMMRKAENAEEGFQGAEKLARHAEELISGVIGSKKEEYSVPIDSTRLSKNAATSAAIIDDTANMCYFSIEQQNQELQYGITAIAKELTGVVSRIPSLGQVGDSHEINLTQFNSSQTDAAADLTQAINTLDHQIETM